MSIYEKLFDYQKNIINTYKDRESFGLFLDMGIGKTPISLAFAEQHQCTKIIIVSINAKVLEDENINGSFFWWANQSSIKYNLYNKKCNFNIDSGKKSKYNKIINPSSNDIFLINYEALYIEDKRTGTYVLRENLDEFIRNCKNCNVCIIIDESHKIKDTSSVQTKMISRMIRNTRLFANNVYTYLLTGTPFTRGFEDLYNQLKLLGWEGTRGLFEEMFCVKGNIPSLMPWQQPIVDYKNVKGLFELVHKYAITIKSEEVLNLPEQLFVYHSLPISKEMRLFTSEKLKPEEINKELTLRGINEVIEDSERNGKVNNPFYGNIDYPSFNWVADTVTKFYLRARQLSIGFQGNEESAQWFNKNRLKELEKLLTENEDNYLLFYNFTPEFVELYELCEKLGYKIDVYNGIIKSEKYYNQYINLSEGLKLVEKKRILLVNYASGATAKNWQGYNKCILFSLPLFGDYQQGIKRIHRVGQKDTVIYHIFYENNWLDKKMLQALKDKKEYDKDMFKQDLKNINL